MAKLKWDQEGQKFFETGVSEVALYPAASAGGYGNGVAWSGMSSIQESPEGADPNDVYADNIKYLTIIGAENLKGTIEAFYYPDEFAECNGEVEALADGGLYFGQQNRKAFGLVYKTVLGNDTQLTNYSYKLHFLYGCTISPSDKEYATINDNPEANTMSWEFSTVPNGDLPTVAGKTFKPTASVVVDASKILAQTSNHMQDLLDYVYGTGSGSTGTAPKLPSPRQIYNLLTTGSEADPTT